MTDELIERLHREAVHPSATVQMRLIAMEAASALEAQASEIERLKGLLNDSISVQEVASRLYNTTLVERDALQAKLDAAQAQEPIYQYMRGDGCWIDQTKDSYDYNRKYGASEVRIVYASPVVQQPLTDERKEAMEVYTPPFKYQHGYIFDSQHHMVADDDKVEEAVAARIRGWGKLSYLPNGAAIQDELGKTVADALTAYYAAHGIGGQPSPVVQQPLTDEQIDGCWDEAQQGPEHGMTGRFARAIEAAHGIGGQQP